MRTFILGPLHLWLLDDTFEVRFISDFERLYPLRTTPPHLHLLAMAAPFVFESWKSYAQRLGLVYYCLLR